MKRPVAVLVAVLALGLAAILLLVRPTAPPLVPAAPPVAATAPVPARPAAPVAQAASKPAGELAFHRLDIDTLKPAAEACLVFSERLVEDGSVRYEDFLELTPTVRIGLRPSAERLCIEGLAFGREYQAVLREGLPAASGLRLAIAETVPVTLRDKPALVAFRDGLILPRETGGGVPITTVNVEKVALKLYRVPDRLVSQIRPEQVAQREAWPWTMRQLAEEQAALVWSGEMPVSAARNETVTTIFPLRQAVREAKPGVYVVAARDAAAAKPASDDDDYRDNARVAIQWLVETDIGLTSFTGADGLHVFARSFRTAKPITGIEVALVARDNDELARATTDAGGHVRFDPGLLRGVGAAAARLAMAYGAAGDFAFQDLARPAFDLSDRGVEGRELPGPVDALVYTDRGIYRPGETAHIVTLLRDRVADAIQDTPIVLVLQRPDGIEYRRFVVADAGAGAHPLSVPLTDTAPRGHWQALAYVDAGGKPVGRAEFDVDDFVPQRLKLALTPAQSLLHPGEDVRIDVEARFLYGAPAAGLDGEGELTVSADPAAFPMHPGFRFGLAEESFKDQVLPLQVATSDDGGRSAAEGRLDGIAETTLPLRAEARVAIFEPGGRATDDRVALKLRTRPLAIGIRPLFRGGRVQEDAEAGFEIIAVDEAGARIAREGLQLRLTEERTDYNWYRGERGWRYERHVRDRTMEDATLAVPADAAASFKHRFAWGYYRLTVSDKEGGAATSIRFSAGWRGVLSEDRPDRVEISADKESYKPGETAKLAIRPPTAGEALVVVASDRVFATRLVSVPADGATVELPVTADWGSGAYAVVAQYRPLGAEAARAPVRAIGVAWLGLDTADRRLAISLGAPAKITPRQRLAVPVSVTGGGDAKAYVTLAAVDEGILQLTNFKSPAPAEWYFGKRRLAVDIRDDYGRLIDTRNAMLAQLRQGGDAVGGRGLDVVPTKTVALFSGLVALDAAGHAEIPLDIPDFAGELRLMALAFTAHHVGAAEAPLTIRDPVVAEAVLPRFLAPGDKSRLSLNLHNVEGAAGAYTVRLGATGPVTVAGAAEQIFQLPEGKRELVAFPIEATAPGIASIRLDLSGPGFSVTRDWPIQVRPGQAPVTTQRVTSLAPGAETRLDAALLAGALPGTGKVTASLSSYRLFDIAALLQSLDRYPFGCLEQTTSRAFPLLFFNDLALLGGTRQDRGVEARVQEAIYRVLDMQTSDGGFGMWSAFSGSAGPWLSLYALDFLGQAKAKSYVVPDDALRRGQGFLRRIASGGRDEVESAAYAHYLLAREGAANAAELRLFSDQVVARRAIGAGHLGAALVQIGDRARAGAAFRLADQLLDDPRAYRYGADYLRGDYYGSPLRDLAGLTALAAEAGQSTLVAGLVERFGRVQPQVALMTTQEKSWALLAAQALTRNRGRLAIGIDGAAPAKPGDPVQIVADEARLISGVTLRNEGDREIWQTVTVTAIPQAPLPAAGNGVTVERRFLTLAGEDADPAVLKQNDRLIVRLDGRATDELHHEFVLLDLLPAGWEIEAIVPRNDDGTSRFGFLPPLKRLRLKEGRDDRMVAAFNADGSLSPRSLYRFEEEAESADFTVAYVIRATIPGTYTLPAIVVEDMYRPEVTARNAVATVTVLPRE